MQCQLNEIVTAAPGDGACAAVSTMFLVIACIVRIPSSSNFFNISQKLGWEEHLKSDLFCVKWDIKPP